MKSKYFLITFFVVLISGPSIGQTLYSRCISNCSIVPPRLSISNVKVLNNSGDIFITGSDDFLGYDFLSLLDSLAIPVWNQKFGRTQLDTIWGPIDTIKIEQFRNIIGSSKINDSSFGILVPLTRKLYQLSNNTTVYLGTESQSAVVSLFNKAGNLSGTFDIRTDSLNNLLFQLSVSGSMLLASGYTLPSGNQALICIDTSGTLLWSKSILNSDSRQIAKTFGYFDEGFLVLSSDSLGAFLTKLDSSGNTVWNYNFSSNGVLYGKDLLITGDSSIYLLASNSAGSPINTCIIKLNPIGQLQWANSYGVNQPNCAMLLVAGPANIKLMVMDTVASTRPNTLIELDTNGTVTSANVIYHSYSVSGSTSYSSETLHFFEMHKDCFLGGIIGSMEFPIVAQSGRYGILVRYDNLYNNCYFSKYSVTATIIPLNVSINSISSSDSILPVTILPYNMNYYMDSLIVHTNCTSTVGFGEEAVESPISFTNPCSGIVEIRANPDKPIRRLELYDLKGVLQFYEEFQNSNSVNRIYLPENLRNGVYIIKIDKELLLSSKLVLIRR